MSVEVRAGFFAGYQSVRWLTRLEALWWDILLLWHSWRWFRDDPTGWGPSALSHLTQPALKV